MRDGGQNLYRVKGRPSDIPYVPPKGLLEHISRLLWLIAGGFTVGLSCLVIDLLLGWITGVN